MIIMLLICVLQYLKCQLKAFEFVKFVFPYIYFDNFCAQALRVDGL